MTHRYASNSRAKLDRPPATAYPPPSGGSAMEPDLVAYSPILHRPPLRWPNGARVALWVVPNIEHYEYLPKFVRTRDPWPRSPHPDLLGYTQRDYGNRVGLWRLFDADRRAERPLHRQPEHGGDAALPGNPRRDGRRAAGSTCRTASTTRGITGTSRPMRSARRWRSRRTSTSASPGGGCAAGSVRRSPTRWRRSTSRRNAAMTIRPICITTISRSR